MQDPSTYTQINPQFPEHEHLKCPRCDSNNTKFCYYNNYNLSQPRHFCKNCRRYWTKGGTLRNIPIGGGSRKNTKRSSNPKRSPTSPSPASASASATSPTTTSSLATQSQPKPEPSGVPGFEGERRMLDIGGSFSSLLASGGQFGNFIMNGVDPNMESMQVGGFTEHPNSDESGMIQTPPTELRSNNNSDNFLTVQSGGDSGCWNGGNGWPDLSIYTPGSTFQ